MRPRTRRLKSLLVVIGSVLWSSHGHPPPSSDAPRRRKGFTMRSESLPPFASRGPSLGEGRRGWAWIAAAPRMPHSGAGSQEQAGKASRRYVGRGSTVFLGSAEVLGSAGVALGILIQLAALGLILLMLGAIQKKIFVWKTGFWGARGYGWHYDLMLLVMSLVILLTGGGRLVLLRSEEHTSELQSP